MNPDTVPIFGPHLGVIFVSLAHTRENREHPERILQRVKERVDAWWAANPTRADNVLTMPPRNGPPLGKPVAVQVRADDYQLGKDVAREIKAFLRQVPGVYNIEDNLLAGPREVRLSMDETRASIHGLTFQEVGMALRGATDGLVASTFKDPKADEDIDIRLTWEDRYRKHEQDLLETEVRTPRGYRVRVGDVANIEVDRGFLSLRHHETRRSVIVYADVLEEVAQEGRPKRRAGKRHAREGTRLTLVDDAVAVSIAARHERLHALRQFWRRNRAVAVSVERHQPRHHDVGVLRCERHPGLGDDRVGRLHRRRRHERQERQDQKQ
jgi:multidrug efflux pump subunit AcrB